MYHIFRGREQGILSPVVVRRVEMTRGLFSLELSVTHRFERVHRHGISALAMESLEQRYLLSGGSDGRVCLHDVEDGAVRSGMTTVALKGQSRGANTHTALVSAVSWFPWENSLFITSSYDGTIRVWDPHAMQSHGQVPFFHKIFSHAISPIAMSHTLVAAATEDTHVRLCDLRVGASCHSLTGHHSNGVLSVQWSPRFEHVLASGGSDGRVLFWDVRKSSGPLTSLNQHNVSEDGRSFERRTQTGGTAHNDAVLGLQFSSDGVHLVSAGMDNALRLWDAQRGRNMLVNYGPVAAPAAANVGRGAVQFAVSRETDLPLIFFPTSSTRGVAVFDMCTGERVHALKGHAGKADCVILRPGAPEAFTAGRSGQILMWAPEQKRQTVVPDAWSDDDDA